MDVRLPEALRAAIEALQVESGKQVSRRVADLSAAYRAMQPSRQAVAGEADVAAYLAARMPATFAAVTRGLG